MGGSVYESFVRSISLTIKLTKWVATRAMQSYDVWTLARFDTPYDLPLLVKHGQSAFSIRLQNPRARWFQPATLPIPFSLLPTQTNILFLLLKLGNKRWMKISLQTYLSCFLVMPFYRLWCQVRRILFLYHTIRLTFTDSFLKHEIVNE